LVCSQKKIGITHYNEKADSEWLELLMEREPDFPDFKTLKRSEVHKLKFDRPKIAFREQIEDVEKNPFPTPSGKIEIFSSMFEKMNNPLIPAVPEYIPVEKGNEDNLTGNFPIALISPHSKARVNSQFDNIESFEKLKDDDLWLNAGDAKIRGIKNGDMVFVFNRSGRIHVRVKVTPDIMSGVASLDEGQWYKPDMDAIDKGGCVNVLTSDDRSPVGAFPSNTCFVQIEKA
jgi:anaerobic dimethyl sulfoxide reductase subunit A